MAPGTIVKCLFPGSYPLTLGKFYEVLEHDGSWITLKGDTGVLGSYAFVRFEVVQHAMPNSGRSVA